MATDGGARLRLSLGITDGGERQSETLTVFSAHLSRLPKCGVLTNEAYEALVAASEHCHALTLGLRLLGGAGASRLQLVQKLCRRGVRRALAQEVAEELAERGFGDEKQGALSEAQKGVAKLWGDRRILLDVRAKGYDAAALDAVREFLKGEDSTRRCERLIARRFKGIPTEEKAMARFLAALARYGYTAAEIKAALANMHQ